MPDRHPSCAHTALAPRYAAHFACTGAACEDTCCAGWAIPVDKPSFDACCQAEPAELAERFKRVVRPIPNAPPNLHARIELVAHSQACPFLEQGLCAIHRELGEDFLSNTCASFPRQTRQFAGQFEHVLALSCPEAARMALLAPDALDLIEAEIVVRAESVVTTSGKLLFSEQDANEIRGFCFQLVRTGSLQLWQRLAIIGHFCHQLDQLIQKQAYRDIARFLADFVDQIENGEMLHKLTGATLNHGMQAQLFFKFWEGQAERKNSATQADVQRAVAQGLGGNAGSGESPNQEDLIRHYLTGLKRMNRALEATPVLLENFLANEMLRECFPFDSVNPYQHFLGLMARFGLLRLMLAGVCNADTLPDASMLIRTTQVFARLYPHPAFTGSATDALKYLGFDHPERFAELLRTAE